MAEGIQPRYKAGDRLTLKIGDRPEMVVTVLSVITTKPKPHYKIDWTEHGFDALLNTVPIPETSFLESGGSVNIK